jgi:zinc protease
MLAKIRATYENIPAGTTPTLFVRPEPVQNGERRVRVERPGSATFLQYAYRAPSAKDDDFFALEIVNSLLCGPSGMGGGGTDNKTSRLYKALVETEYTVGIYGDTTPTIDPFLYTITTTLREGRTPEEVETILNREIERMRSGDFSEAEIVRAKKQSRALFAYSTERVTSQALWLAWSELFAGYTWFETYLDRLNAVTYADVQRVAERILRPQNRVVGTFVPTNSKAETTP